MEKQYTFHWKNGKVNSGMGSSPSDAFTKLGFSGGALTALDYYTVPSNKDSDDSIAIEIFNIFDVAKVPLGSKSELDTSIGCDGLQHAVAITRLWYDDEDFPEQATMGAWVSANPIGACDGTCEGKARSGSFTLR